MAGAIIPDTDAICRIGVSALLPLLDIALGADAGTEPVEPGRSS
jgi:hypothetical protein